MMLKIQSKHGILIGKGILINTDTKPVEFALKNGEIDIWGKMKFKICYTEGQLIGKELGKVDGEIDRNLNIIKTTYFSQNGTPEQCNFEVTDVDYKTYKETKFQSYSRKIEQQKAEQREAEPKKNNQDVAKEESIGEKVGTGLKKGVSEAGKAWDKFWEDDKPKSENPKPKSPPSPRNNW